MQTTQNVGSCERMLRARSWGKQAPDGRQAPCGVADEWGSYTLSSTLREGLATWIAMHIFLHLGSIPSENFVVILSDNSDNQSLIAGRFSRIPEHQDLQEKLFNLVKQLTLRLCPDESRANKTASPTRFQTCPYQGL